MISLVDGTPTGKSFERIFGHRIRDKYQITVNEARFINNCLGTDAIHAGYSWRQREPHKLV